MTEYCFPKSYGLLDKPDFAPDFHDLWISILGNSHVLKQFPWMFPMMLSFPEWFVERALPDLAVTYKWHREWRKQIQAVKSNEDDREKRAGRPSIFETLLDSDLPPFDKSVSRLVEDAQTMVGAGSITTSLSLTLGTYYIASDGGVRDKLMEELEAAIPEASGTIPLTELEQLPYLTAVYLEILRISYGVCHRLQRVCPDQVIQYHEYTLPPGTPISMTSMLIHDNVAIFPEPRVFRPERWLPLETKGAHLQKYLVAFSRGSRQCLGMRRCLRFPYFPVRFAVDILRSVLTPVYGTRFRTELLPRHGCADLKHDWQIWVLLRFTWVLLECFGGLVADCRLWILIRRGMLTYRMIFSHP